MTLLHHIKKITGTLLLAVPILGAKPYPNLETLVQENVSEETDQTKENTKNRINYHRSLVGLEGVSLAEELCKDAELHAKYLASNLTIREVNHNGIIRLEYSINIHDEDRNLQGYTDIGARLAPGAEIYFGDPIEIVDRFMASFYHRTPFIAPGIKYFGVGVSSGGNWNGGKVTVVIFKTDSNTIRPPSNRTIIYPANNQTDIPALFGISEHPNPIPKEDKDGIGGFPITVTFPSFAAVEDYSIRLSRGNLDVGGYLVTLLGGPFNIDNHLCFIPQDPLETNTQYTAKATARVNGNLWDQTWTFRTKKR